MASLAIEFELEATGMSVSTQPLSSTGLRAPTSRLDHKIYKISEASIEMPPCLDFRSKIKKMADSQEAHVSSKVDVARGFPPAWPTN